MSQENSTPLILESAVTPDTIFGGIVLLAKKLEEGRLNVLEIFCVYIIKIKEEYGVSSPLSSKLFSIVYVYSSP